MAEYIDREAFMQSMYHEAFEKDSDLQKWDSGCWIRYKLLENVMSATPPADVRTVVHGKWKHGVCQICFFDWLEVAPFASVQNYCPNCGADMREES